jgi:hypothetical protein
VRRVLTSSDRGLSSPKALAHYRTGLISLDEIAAWVSYDLTGGEAIAERLTPVVERVVAELGAVEESAQS